jgi:heme A synthase
MLTVTWQLKPLIVTLHLLFGMTTLGLLWWLWLSLPRQSWGGMRMQGAGRPAFTGGGGGGASAMRIAHLLAVTGLVALAVQILLGGWTSSNYAAVACPDFPSCQNAWWPHTDYRNAFVLWRGLGINYEGGVLDNPARVAIHLTHRLGAIVATLALGLAAGFGFAAVPGRPAARGVCRSRSAGAAAGNWCVHGIENFSAPAHHGTHGRRSLTPFSHARTGPQDRRAMKTTAR